MGEYRDGPPKRLMVLVGGAALCIAVSEFTGVAGIVSAFTASATDGAVGTPIGDGMALVNKMVEFLVGVAVAAVILGLILIVTRGFEE